MLECLYNDLPLSNLNVTFLLTFVLYLNVKRKKEIPFVYFLYFTMVFITGLSMFYVTAQKTKFSIKDFFSKCDQIRSFLVHGTILQQWAPILKNSDKMEKRKNLARNCWTVVPVTVEEQSCQPLVNNRASDCWTMVPATVEESCQPLLKNRASDC